MPSSNSKQPRCILPLAAALALLAAATFAPAARADTSGSVRVFAQVATELRLTLCDTAANFGTGLNSLGATPSETDDRIDVTSPTVDGSYLYYLWTPECQWTGSGGPFLEVVSTSPWSATVCATENVGEGASETMKVANGVLRFGLDFDQTAEEVDDHAVPFDLCDDGVADFDPFGVVGAGTRQMAFYYFLRVGVWDAAGTFSSTTTWTAMPA
jgi:hypothetical protein